MIRKRLRNVIIAGYGYKIKLKGRLMCFIVDWKKDIHIATDG